LINYVNNVLKPAIDNDCKRVARLETSLLYNNKANNDVRQQLVALIDKVNPSTKTEIYQEVHQKSTLKKVPELSGDWANHGSAIQKYINSTIVPAIDSAMVMADNSRKTANHVRSIIETRLVHLEKQRLDFQYDKLEVRVEDLIREIQELGDFVQLRKYK